MELTSYKKILLLLTLMIQSSIGMALSLAHLWTYSETLRILVTERQGDFFKYFCIAGFAINALLLTLSLLCITVMVADLMLTRGTEHRMSRRLVTREERAVYGAFGYYSVI